TSSAEVTSQPTAVPPISSASAAMRSRRRAAHTTCKPSRASARAVAAPMPLLAPVTTAMRRLDESAGTFPPVGVASCGAGRHDPAMQLRRACALLALLGGLVLLAVGVAAVLGDPAGWHDTASWVGYGLVLLAFAGLGYLLVEKAPLWLGLIVAVCFP